eukprot:COSAG02_NODE_54301_length_296_cov_68.218274_1_plen_24_part_10
MKKERNTNAKGWRDTPLRPLLKAS